MNIQNLTGLILLIVVCWAGPITVAILLKNRFSLPLRIFFISAAFYLLTLAVQLPIFYLLIHPWFHRPHNPLVYLVVTAGIFAISEEGSRYLSWRAGTSMRENRNWNGALLAGLGYGEAQAFVHALGLPLEVLVALVAPQIFPVNSSFPPGFTGVLLFYPLFRLYGIEILHCVLTFILNLFYAQLSVLAYGRSVIFLLLVIGIHWIINVWSMSIPTWSQPAGYISRIVLVIACLVIIFSMRKVNSGNNRRAISRGRRNKWVIGV
ncbi:MAG: hypothetical protein ACREN8_12655 [Candidatus Dormibacteraceae bacterium]